MHLKNNIHEYFICYAGGWHGDFIHDLLSFKHHSIREHGLIEDWRKTYPNHIYIVPYSVKNNRYRVFNWWEKIGRRKHSETNLKDYYENCIDDTYKNLSQPDVYPLDIDLFLDESNMLYVNWFFSQFNIVWSERMEMRYVQFKKYEYFMNELDNNFLGEINDVDFLHPAVDAHRNKFYRKP